jgi:hypothetical protein
MGKPDRKANVPEPNKTQGLMSRKNAQIFLKEF